MPANVCDAKVKARQLKTDCLKNCRGLSLATRKEPTMSTVDIVRAWKDAEYRQSLSEAERAQLPDHPAGLIELTDAELDGVAAGADPKPPENLTIYLPCTFVSPCNTTTMNFTCYPSSTYKNCGLCLP
jgi:mersacidin/lichenicidin family type 2 lantibiotic